MEWYVIADNFLIKLFWDLGNLGCDKEEGNANGTECAHREFGTLKSDVGIDNGEAERNKINIYFNFNFN
jgi:hypothetical protein